ncbi:MAG: uracil-DNA glycosylase [Bacteroidia bacterium]|nr:uracil-DNA glycosylase [Bacteroidia bacterium]
MNEINIESSWKIKLSDALNNAAFIQLKDFLFKEKAANKIIFPPEQQIFAAFNSIPFEKVKVVILGQDPYHRLFQAHGLCFSVNDGIPLPPSLKNIFKELQQDVPDFTIPESGNLTKWTTRGVLLLNAILTVRTGQAGSHQKLGWEHFTDEVIRELSKQRNHLVFILWGNFAQSKVAFIDPDKHLILKAAHPSPLSAHNGFFGCKHFSMTNNYLIKQGIEPIDWNL